MAYIAPLQSGPLDAPRRPSSVERVAARLGQQCYAAGVRKREKFSNLAALVCFGIAFGYVEAAVVMYLRSLIHIHGNYTITNYHILLNLGFITFVSPVHSLLITSRFSSIEVFREAATIVMLAAVSFVASKSWRQRLGAFLVCFACWDLAYYLFLRVVEGWPLSLLTTDVYFLIPVTWIGPVITPLVISSAMLVGGIWLFISRDHSVTQTG